VTGSGTTCGTCSTAFAPDGRTLLARERTVAAWNLGTGEAVQVWGGADRVADDLAVHAGTGRFVTLGPDGTVRRSVGAQWCFPSRVGPYQRMLATCPMSPNS
jgi:hypothetical protein